MPPVIKRSGEEHRKRAPDDHPRAEWSTERTKAYRSGALLGCPEIGRTKREPTSGEAGNQSAKVDGDVRRGPESVAANRRMPGDIPERTDGNAGRAEHDGEAVPWQCDRGVRPRFRDKFAG